ncbi:MAG: DNA-3-methyladenine glycosylase family protein [Nocardioidaceae bacterium]
MTAPPTSPRLRLWHPNWPCDPFDIIRGLRRGAGDPAFQRDPDGTVWRVSQTPEGPVTLRLTARPQLGEIEAEAWGSGTSWALDQVPSLLGTDDDPTGFAPDHPTVRRAWERNPHWRVMRTGLALEATVAAVIEQKVTGQEAFAGWRNLLRRHGHVAPGPGVQRRMRCLPTAGELAMIPSWAWLRCHIDPARSRTVVRAAKVADALERTLDVPADEAERRLRSIPGIGEWTAAEVRQRAHGDADAVSFGDYHIATHIGWALTGEPMTDEELRVFLEPSRPHRYRVQHVVTTRVPGRPRRGPRMAPRTHLPV